MKATKEQLRKFIHEEADTSMLYAHLGFTKQAKQEKEHAEFFRKKYKEMM